MKKLLFLIALLIISSCSKPFRSNVIVKNESSINFCVSSEVASNYGFMDNLELAEIRIGDSALFSRIAGSRNSVKYQINNFEDSSLHFVFYRLLSNDNGRLRFERHKYFVIKRKYDELESSNWHLVLTDSMIPKEYLKSIADTTSISFYRK